MEWPLLVLFTFATWSKMKEKTEEKDGMKGEWSAEETHRPVLEKDRNKNRQTDAPIFCPGVRPSIVVFLHLPTTQNSIHHLCMRWLKKKKHWPFLTYAYICFKWTRNRWNQQKAPLWKESQTKDVSMVVTPISHDHHGLSSPSHSDRRRNMDKYEKLGKNVYFFYEHTS